jgi:hypothetical protein
VSEPVLDPPSPASPDQADEGVACPLPPPPAKGLTGLEKGELAAILLALGGLWLATGGLAWTLQFGTVVAYASAVILGQGLTRDLVRLAVDRRDGPKKRMMCLCAESSIGILLLAAGLGLLLIGISDTVTLSQPKLVGLVAGLLVLGFLAKDYVLIVRKEKDHGSVLLF